MSVTYYTTPSYEKAVIANASNNTADMQHVLNQNMNITWTGQSGNWYTTVDLYPQDEDAYAAGRGKTSGSYESIGIWFANYDTDMTGETLSIFQGYDSGPAESLGSGLSMATMDGPLFVLDLGTPVTKRYVRVYGGTWTEVPEIGGVFVCNQHTLDRSHEHKGSERIPSFDNTVVKLTGLAEHVSVHQTNPIYEYKRKYKLISASEITWVDSVVEESSGRRNLFIINEGTTQADNFLCRFKKDKPKWKDITGDYREATLEFKTIPYVSDGETL